MILCHHRGAQNHSPEHSRSPFLAGGMIFPPGMLDPCQSSRNNWKLISFNTTWLHHKKKIFSLFCIFLSLLPLLACTYLNNAWDLVLWALPLSVCLFKINRFVSPNCKSLWIKASAKWLNVNSVSLETIVQKHFSVSNLRGLNDSSRPVVRNSFLLVRYMGLNMHWAQKAS